MLTFSMLRSYICLWDRDAIFAFLSNDVSDIDDHAPCDEKMYSVFKLLAEVYYDDIEVVKAALDFFSRAASRGGRIVCHRSLDDYREVFSFFMEECETRKCYSVLKHLLVMKMTEVDDLLVFSDYVIEDEISLDDFVDMLSYVLEKWRGRQNYHLDKLLYTILLVAKSRRIARRERDDDDNLRIVSICRHLFSIGATIVDEQFLYFCVQEYSMQRNVPMTLFLLEHGGKVEWVSYKLRKDLSTESRLHTLILGLDDKKSNIYKYITASKLGERHVLNYIAELAGSF